MATKEQETRNYGSSWSSLDTKAKELEEIDQTHSNPYQYKTDYRYWCHRENFYCGNVNNDDCSLSIWYERIRSGPVSAITVVVHVYTQLEFFMISTDPVAKEFLKTQRVSLASTCKMQCFVCYVIKFPSLSTMNHGMRGLIVLHSLRVVYPCAVYI